MTTFDLVIVGGTIVTASDTFNADIGIKLQLLQIDWKVVNIQSMLKVGMYFLGG